MNRIEAFLIKYSRFSIPETIRRYRMVSERNDNGVVEVTSLLAHYPRFIHSELLRHKRLSHSVGSSRAIPTKRYIANLSDFEYRTWRQNQSGMSPKKYIADVSVRKKLKSIWASLSENSINAVLEMGELGLAKEQVNRALEPYSFVEDLVTGTHSAFKAMLHLRLDQEAQYEIRKLAMRIARIGRLNSSELAREFHNHIHLPYVDVDMENLYSGIVSSIARCARTSYRSHETGKESTLEEDIVLYEKLIMPEIPHINPSEHVVMSYDLFYRVLCTYEETIENYGIGFAQQPIDFVYKTFYEQRLEGCLDPGVVQLRRAFEVYPFLPKFILDSARDELAGMGVS